MYNSRLHKPNENFNYWQDINLNVTSVNNWEKRSIATNNEDSQSNYFFSKKESASVGPPLKRQRSVGGELNEKRYQNVVVESVKAVTRIPEKHKARYVYSQVYLGSDTEDVISDRSASPASRFGKSSNFPKVVYD
jgi:hypothetical protein